MESICIDIMNSAWQDHLGKKSEDRLDSLSWLEALLDKYSLGMDKGDFDSLRMELKELRSIMKTMAGNLMEGEPVDKASLGRLNKYLEKTRHCHHAELHDNGLALLEIQLENGNNSILGQVAFSFAELITKQDPRRLKMCKNPDCRWIFFDESKNRNKCWCESKTCGNLMKVRSYRERKKLES